MPMVDVVNLTIWYQIKSYLPAGTRLTSVYRPAQAQLDFIVSKARKHGFKFTKAVTLKDQASWQTALEYIRTKGYKVAAPGKSAHQMGIAYDFSGPDLPKIEKAIRRAVADGRITLANSRSAILVEKRNRCVHVEIVGAIIHNESFDFMHAV
jgi:hypothetical protein